MSGTKKMNKSMEHRLLNNIIPGLGIMKAAAADGGEERERRARHAPASSKWLLEKRINDGSRWRNCLASPLRASGESLHPRAHTELS
jgi:hypothetical protein